MAILPTVAAHLEVLEEAIDVSCDGRGTSLLEVWEITENVFIDNNSVMKLSIYST